MVGDTLSDKPNPDSQQVVLDRSEWNSLIDEVKKLIQAHEQLLKEQEKIDTSSGCTYCGSDLAPTDRFCRICGRTVKSHR
jgi:hypothetical protein